MGHRPEGGAGRSRKRGGWGHASLTHMSSIPSQGREDEDVQEQHAENVVERKAVLALARGIGSHALIVKETDERGCRAVRRGHCRTFNQTFTHFFLGRQARENAA